ncbi:MAG: TIGR03067 domain-containing protein [Planctomycetaceae bacterium]
MAIRFRLVLCGALVCMGGDILADDKESDQARMEGAWEVVELVQDGTPVPKEVFATWRVKFAGNRLTIVESQGSHAVVFKLDPSSRPKGMDSTPLDGPQKGKTLRGIYDVQGDSVKVCLPREEGAKRPTEFVSGKGSDLGLLMLKRASK